MLQNWAYNRDGPRLVKRARLFSRPDMFLAYTLLFSIGLVLTAPYYLWRLRGRITRWADWRERLGWLPKSFQQAERGAVWIHAVSVGETIAVVPLVKAIRESSREVKIFLSHTTPAGRQAGESRMPDVEGRFFLPLDWPWAVRRAMERIRPTALLVVETELWPNLLRAAHDFGTRVALVNARLSERSYRRYRLAPRFMRRVLGCVDWIGAQTPAEAERLLELGARPERLTIAGNLKFDGRPPRGPAPACAEPKAGRPTVGGPPELSALSPSLGRALRAAGRGPVMIAASTMPGEEEKVLKAWNEIRRSYPEANLILAPRHPARFDAVAGTLKRLKFVRRTDFELDGAALANRIAEAEVLLLDTIGELAGLFEIADVVFVGGSLVPAGGHNLLEPAFWAKPILFGPHMENFRDAAEIFVKAGGAFQVHDEMELAKKALQLFGDPKMREEAGRRAKQALDSGSGATERTMGQIQAWLEARRAAPAAVRGGEGK
ncbi:MAG: 3-deoxy-D-manno-octulosonic acid transferase [Acidobacteria bacterium]|nr:MAG: 3-deoxy-D-manno-octulosonic acid transferase [Acidobacteriota bacterium]